MAYGHGRHDIMGGLDGWQCIDIRSRPEYILEVQGGDKGFQDHLESLIMTQ